MNVFNLWGKLAIDGVDKAKKDIDSVTDNAEQNSSKLSKTLSALGGVSKIVGTAVVGAVGAVGTAIVGITKQAVSAYGEYEQLVGGIKTLLGDETAKQVLQYAEGAYASAGLSANKYMEMVTSFTASLLQGLNGDTAETARVADMAIQDMSDNANKMGTSMEMIQNAYQGFSKQNYTMLDNLKLGYGGTKEEMQRLLAHATELTGIEYDISNLADVYNAIHAVQQELGITGATADEASTTITGSMSAVKASWENILVGLAGDNKKLSGLIQIFIDNLITMLKNMLPIVGQVLANVPNLIIGLVPIISKTLMELVPQLLTAISNVMTSLFSSIPTLFSKLDEVLKQIADYIKKELPNAMNLFSTVSKGTKDLLTQLADYLEKNLPIVIDKAKVLMTQFGEKIKENLPTVVSKALDIMLSFSQTILEKLPKLVTIGMDLIKNLVQGIMASLPTLIAKAPQIITNLANAFSRSMTTIFAKGVQIIWEIIKGIISAIPTLIANIPKVIEAIVAVWTAFNWWNLGKNLVTGIAKGIKNFGGTLKDTATNLFNQLDENIGIIFNKIKTTITNPMTSAQGIFSTLITKMKDIAISGFGLIKSNATTIFNNIKNAITSPISSARDIIKGILDTIKGFFSGFKISIPKIPLPHFSVKPSGWGIGDLLKGKIPSLGISWYDKAMDNPMILDSPTLFGYKNGKLLGGGETGEEVVSGKNTLLDMIKSAVNSETKESVNVLENILKTLQDVSSKLNRPIMLDSGLIVGYMLEDIDTGLGDIATLKLRGVK